MTATATQAGSTSARPAETPPPRRIEWTDVLLWAWGIGVFIFLFVPILVIVVYSFNAGRYLETWQGFGFEAFQNLWNNGPIHDAFKTSIVAAMGASVLATILGTLAGLALARKPGKWTVGFLFVVALVLVTPEIVDAISLLLWYVFIGGPFGNGFSAHIAGMPLFGLNRLFVGHGLFATAVVTLIVRARMSGVDESLEEAAADLYAPPMRRFRQITLPLVMPAVLASLLLAFSLSLDNTIISTFTSVAGATPWPVYVWSALRSILRPEIAAMSTVMLALTLFALGCVALVLRRSGDSSTDIAKTMAGG